MHLEKWDFDFPRHKETHILQENTLCKLAVVILLLEQHEPPVLIRGTLCLATSCGNTFSYKTALEDPVRSSFCAVRLNRFLLSITLNYRFLWMPISLIRWTEATTIKQGGDRWRQFDWWAIQPLYSLRSQGTLINTLFLLVRKDTMLPSGAPEGFSHLFTLYHIDKRWW